MSQKQRRGNLQSREARLPKKRIKLAYYLIITDTEGTERCYFEGLQQALPLEIKSSVQIRVIETKTKSLIEKALIQAKYDPQYRNVWIVFDRDQIKEFDQIIQEAQNKGVNVGWSNPCFEIWMYAYFGKMPSIRESNKCCSEFAHVFRRQTKQEYSKTDSRIYAKLCKYGNEEKAIQIAKNALADRIREKRKSPSEMNPATTVYELVREIRKKGEC